MAEDIFLSYSTKDHEAAQRIAALLEGSGWTVWWDARLRAGALWRSSIDEALCNSRCMVVLWSRNSIASQWVREEAEQARQAGKLVPIRIDDVRPPLGFRELHYSDLSAWNGSPQAAAFRQLVLDLEATLGKPKVPSAATIEERHTAPTAPEVRVAAGVGSGSATSAMPQRRRFFGRRLLLAAGAAVLLCAIAALSIATQSGLSDRDLEVPTAKVALPTSEPEAPDERPAVVTRALPVDVPKAPTASTQTDEHQPPAQVVRTPEAPEQLDRSVRPADTTATRSLPPSAASEADARIRKTPNRLPDRSSARRASGASDSKCTDILMRLQLGEPVSAPDRAFLKQNCQ